MNAQSLDQAFLKINERTKTVPEDKIAAAKKAQVEEMFSGRPPRPLIDILRDQKALSPAAEKEIRELIEGKRQAPAEEPESPSELLMKARSSLLEMSPRPVDDVQDALDAIEDSEGAAPNPEVDELPSLSPKEELDLGQAAVRHGLITPEQLRQCLAKQLDEITK